MSKIYKNELNQRILNLEFQSDKIISKDKGYILILKTECEKTEELIKKWLVSKRPIFIYSIDRVIYMYFNPTENSEHIYEGSLQKICSNLTSEATILLNFHCELSIVEMSENINILTYLICKYNIHLMRIINNKTNIDINDLNKLTFEEILNKMKKMNIHWEKIEDFTKYGIFYKNSKKNNKWSIDRFSVQLDIYKFNEIYDRLMN